LFQGKFSVMVNDNAAGNVSGTAYADWTDAAAPLTTASNTVVLPLPAHAAGIFFYTNNTYTNRATQSIPGSALYVQTDASICNADPVAVGTVRRHPRQPAHRRLGNLHRRGDRPQHRHLPHPAQRSHGQRGHAHRGVGRRHPGSAAQRHGDRHHHGLRGISVSATTTLLVDPSGTVYNSAPTSPSPAPRCS
jgi:hypothetical protein